MKTLTLLLFGFAAILPARFVRANDNSDLRVDVVVDVTDAGRKIPRPNVAHPAYYYPITKGYTTGGAILAGEKAPPPIAQIEHLVAIDLAKQGYLLAHKSSPPTLLLMFWWGYKAPESENDDRGRLAASSNMAPGGFISGNTKVSYGGVAMDAVNALASRGDLPTDSIANQVEMQELVMGTQFDPEPLHNLPGPREELATNAARVARYYLMVSALDFKAAIERRKYIVYWTARVSTELQGRTLDQVLPTLIADGAPMFGRDTNGPAFTSSPIIPMGQVIVGTPVLKSDSTPAAANAPRAAGESTRP